MLCLGPLTLLLNKWVRILRVKEDVSAFSMLNRPSFQKQKAMSGICTSCPDHPPPPTESLGCLCGATCGSQESSWVSHLGCGALLRGPYRVLNHAQKHEDDFVVVFPTVFFYPTRKLENVILIHINFYFWSLTMFFFLFQWFSFTRNEIHGLIMDYVCKKLKGFLFIHFAFVCLFSSIGRPPWFYSGSRVSNSVSLSLVRIKSPHVEVFTGYLNWYPHCGYIKLCKSFHNATWKCILKAYANICRVLDFTHLKKHIIFLTVGHI